MAGNQFLKIAGVEGESIETGFEKTIEVLSWSFGETNAGSAGAGTGMGTSNVHMQDFNFTMINGKASPTLFLFTAAGEHIPEATLTLLKPTGQGDNQQKYIEFVFTNCLMSSFQTGGSGDGLPVEQLAFNYEQCTMEYFEQDAKGVLKSAGKTGWNVKTNKKV